MNSEKAPIRIFREEAEAIAASVDEAFRASVEDLELSRAVEEYDARQTALSDSPQPLPDTLPPVPCLAPDLLPASIRPWVVDVSERMQCPLEFPAVAAMVGLASVVGRRVGIRPKRRDHWLVIPNLWGTVVGRPGIMKTPALLELLGPIHRLEAKAREDYNAAVRDYEAGRLVGKQAQKVTDEAIRKALRQGDHATADDIARKFVRSEDDRPQRKRYVTNDTTVEKLGELLAANGNGVLVFRDELVGLLRSLEREGQDGSRAFYLEAWAGTGRFTFDRIGRGTIEIEAACVSILGGIQPGPLGEYLRSALTGGVGDDGLLQRFQVVVWPDLSPEWVNVDRWPDSAARTHAWELFQRLDQLSPEDVGAEVDEHEPIPFLRFSQAAQAAFDDWRAGLERRLRGDEDHPAFEAHLSKYRSLIPTLALLSHLADGGRGSVGEIPLMRALAWAETLEAHGRRLYAPALDPALHAARELEKQARLGRLPRVFVSRDVYRKGWRLLDREGTRLALDLLVDLNRIIPQTVETGGRPKVIYRVHPDLLDGSA